MVFQGLAVVPIFCGFDEVESRGRLYTFDVVGGRYEEQDYGAAGSGAREAKAFLRSEYRPDLDEEEALGVGLRALMAAAEEDVATGGPDLRRRIFPNVVTVSAAGLQEVADDRVAGLVESSLETT